MNSEPRNSIIRVLAAVACIFFLAAATLPQIDWVNQIKNKPLLDPRAFATGSATGGLQEAINALPVGGGGIQIPCGYPITLQRSILTTKNLTLIGCGSSSPVALMNGYADSAFLGAVTAGTTVQVLNVFFDGNRNNVPVTQSTGIFAQGATTRLIVQRCVFQNFNANSILHLVDTSYGVITDNLFANNMVHAVLADQTVFANTFHVISHNQFAFSSYPIASCTNTTPVVCTLGSPISMVANYNFAVRGTSVASYNAEVLATPVGTGPLYTRFSINGSTAAGASTGGFLVEGGTAIHLGSQGMCNLSGNEIYNGSAAFDIADSQHNTLSSNHSYFAGDSGLTIEGTPTGVSSRFNIISDFHVDSSMLEGIYMGDYALDNVIQNPVITLAGQWPLVGRGSGVQVWGPHTTRNMIVGGIVQQSREYGVLLAADVAGTRILGTNLGGNPLGPLARDGTETFTLLDVSSSLDNYTYAVISSHVAGIQSGSRVYCADCNSTCNAGSSGGRTCFFENGVWLH